MNLLIWIRELRKKLKTLQKGRKIFYEDVEKGKSNCNIDKGNLGSLSALTGKGYQKNIDEQLGGRRGKGKW